jgi:hypothetical protein
MKLLKKILLLLIFSIFLVNAQKPTDKNNSINQKQKDLNVKINKPNLPIPAETIKMQKQINELKEEINNLKKSLNPEKLKVDIETSSTIMQKQNFLITGLGYALTALSILIGFFAILIYFVGIRPAENAAKKAEDLIKEISQNLDNKLSQFYEIKQKKDFSQALENLYSNEEHIVESAHSYLLLNQTIPFIEDFFEKIYSQLNFFIDWESDGIAGSLSKKGISINTLILLLSKKKSIFGDKFFLKLLSSQQEKRYYFAINYFKKFGFDNYMENIKSLILNSKRVREHFNSIINVLINSPDYKELGLKLINDKEFIDKFLLTEDFESKNTKSLLKMDVSELEKTYLGAEIKRKIEERSSK